MTFIDEAEIEVGIRSVVHLDRYLQELKTAATEFVDAANIVDRGYFSPEEDDRARSLLISYWQSRSALFDVVLEYRRHVTDYERASAAEFLVPFAAALVLLDGARFLRRIAENRPIVRRKFNEPAPAFGIPGGTFDTVQRSLVSSRHAWHLFYALKFYEERQVDLHAEAAGTSASAVAEIVERLKHQLDISVSQFAQAKLRTRGDQWLRALGRSAAANPLYGIQKLAASLMAHVYVRPTHQPSIPAGVRAQMTPLLEVGDVLVVRKEYAMSNYFLPGYWPHVALFLGDQKQLSEIGIRPDDDPHRWERLANFSGDHGLVLESMKDGVRFRSLNSPYGSDSMVIIRPQLDRQQIADAIRRGISHEGKEYDFDFDFRRSDRLVCTEVVYRAFDGIGPLKFDLVRRAGRPSLSGPDLINLARRSQQFEVVAAYVPSLSDQVATREAAIEFIDQVMPKSEPS